MENPWVAGNLGGEPPNGSEDGWSDKDLIQKGKGNNYLPSPSVSDDEEDELTETENEERDANRQVSPSV